jgi:hypothetical protein
VQQEQQEEARSFKRQIAPAIGWKKKGLDASSYWPSYWLLLLLLLLKGIRCSRCCRRCCRRCC